MYYQPRFLGIFYDALNIPGSQKCDYANVWRLMASLKSSGASTRHSVGGVGNSKVPCVWRLVALIA